jgi:hypothetical protein
MYDTPANALSAFIERMEGWETPATPILGDREKVLQAGLEYLRPFLLNPEQHKEQVKLILEGISRAHMAAIVGPMAIVAFSPMMDWMTGARTDFKKGNQRYTDRLKTARAGLLTALNPGELSVNILPARAKASTDSTDRAINRKLILFQVNVALYPEPDFTPQSLSVWLSVVDADVEFSDVEPSSKMDSIGAYEIGIQDSGKFTRTTKDANKLAFTANAQVAKVNTEESTEDSTSAEAATQTSIKRTGSMTAPMIISAAEGKVARWQILRGPNQILRGGSSFFATAFVPPALRKVTLKAKVLADLDGYGAYEAESERQVDLSTESSALLRV